VGGSILDHTGRGKDGLGRTGKGNKASAVREKNGSRKEAIKLSTERETKGVS